MNHLTHDSRLSKLLMPVFSSERNFKVKTPIGGIRSQTPNLVSINKNTKNCETPSDNYYGSKIGSGTDVKRNYQSIQLDLPLSTTYLNGKHSSTFETELSQEPITMRDLDAIDKSQF